MKRREIRVTFPEKDYKYFEELRNSLGEASISKAVLQAVKEYNYMKDRIIFLESENRDYAKLNSSLLEVIEIKKRMDTKKGGN